MKKIIYIADPELCLTDCQDLPKHIQENRALLLQIMQEHGFINYPTDLI